MIDDRDIGGMGLLGGMGCGGAFLMDGSVRDEALMSGTLGFHALDFGCDGELVDDPTGQLFGVYVDRELVGFTTPEAGADTDALSDGRHEVVVVVFRDQDSGIPGEIVGDEQGAFAWIRWGRCADTDLARYEVFWDAGTGTVSYAAPVATVEATVIEGRHQAGPDSGTGTGRVTIGGAYQGPGENQTWHVKVTGTGTFAVDTGDGYGEDVVFTAGASVGLPRGGVVTWHDDPEDYEDDDTWDVAVGPETKWRSGGLADGTYKFTVRTVDGAGNAAVASGVATVAIAQEPDAPAEVTATWDNVTAEVTFGWISSAALVRVYGNWSGIFEERTDWIEELVPLAEVAGSEGGCVVELAGEPGEMRFYVRAVDGNGVEERNASMVVVECSGTVEATLRSPVITSAKPGPGGTVVLTYQVDWSAGAGVPESLNIYAHESATPDWSAATPYDSLAFVGGVFDVDTQVWTSGAGFAGTRWFTVRAVDGDGNETGNVDVTVCVPDDVGPGGVEILEGWQT